MASSTFVLQIPKIRNSTFMGNTLTHPRSHSQISISKRSVISNASVMTPPIATTSNANSFNQIDRIRLDQLYQESKSSPRSIVSLASSWKEIQGCNNWEDLVGPEINPLLRQEITRYGNLVAACYKAFDVDPNSKRYLNCKYGKKTLLQETETECPEDYRVSKYIYATPEININEAARGRWVGYVAVSSDKSVKKLGRRDILVTFRGTVTNPEWIANLMSSLTPARLDPSNPRPEVKVESGFLSLYTSDESSSKFGLESCRQQLLSEISKLLHQFKDEELSITLAGHSMGSSLALLLAYDISELGMNRTSSQERVPVTVFSFAGPRVGNMGFKKRCEELGVKVLRIVNVNDPITKLPGVLFNENFRVLGELPWSYAHVGVQLSLDFFNVQNPTCVHDLESYLQLLNRNKPRSDGFGLGFKERGKQLKNATFNVMNMIGSVSDHMLYYNFF